MDVGYARNKGERSVQRRWTRVEAQLQTHTASFSWRVTALTEEKGVREERDSLENSNNSRRQQREYSLQFPTKKKQKKKPKTKQKNKTKQKIG